MAGPQSFYEFAFISAQPYSKEDETVVSLLNLNKLTKTLACVLQFSSNAHFLTCFSIRRFLQATEEGKTTTQIQEPNWPFKRTRKGLKNKLKSWI